MWRSWLARTAGGREVAGSSPVTPTRLRDILDMSIESAFLQKPEYQHGKTELQEQLLSPELQKPEHL